MYDLPHHKEQNEQVIKEFIDQHPFAFLAGSDSENKPIATQVPVLTEEKDGKKIFRGHIMKNTDHHKAFLHNENVLVVFTGKHTYVSGTWYSNPYTPSTWNYMSVHAKGIIRFLDDKGLVDVLRKTTLHFEDHNKQSSTIFDNLPSEYTQKLMKAIVAFEIEVVEIDTVFKLSQDRDSKSYLNIIEKLKEQGNDGQVIAAEMEKRTRQLFSDGTDTLIKAYSGSEFLVQILKDKLEQKGIIGTIQNNSGDSFLGGTPIALDLYIRQNDIKKAEPVIREFVKKN